MMDSVVDMHTQQINVMSSQLYVQTARVTELQNQVALLGTQLQQTQLHISAVDGRVPAFMTITSILKMLADKINEVILRTRGPSAEEARVMLEDLNMINMELAMGELLPDAHSGKPCDCDFNLLCKECFLL